jgi:dUTP pyrophosphatase
LRGFEVATGYHKEDVILPQRGTKHSAGYDIRVIEDTLIKAGEIVLAPTGLKAFMQNDEVLKVYPRSSLPKNYHLTIPNNVGIIDSDYYENPDNDGAIFVSLYNFSELDVLIKKGERIAQGIFQKFLISSHEEEVVNMRNGGFGCTGK